jgi:ribosomal protein L37AE/L43A
MHAENRAAILEKRARLEQIIEDNAQCPKCHKADMLKRTGVTTTERGWKCNTYKCRRCNIAFTWNRPNNPWHMKEFMQVYIAELELSLQTDPNEEMQAHTRNAIAQLQDSLERLTPVLEASDEEVTALHEKEKEMDRLIHQFKNYLLIEKIKLDTYQEPE